MVKRAVPLAGCIEETRCRHQCERTRHAKIGGIVIWTSR
jgi:hypothetical protein